MDKFNEGDLVLDCDGYPYKVTEVSESGRSIKLDDCDFWFQAHKFEPLKKKPIFPFLTRIILTIKARWKEAKGLSNGS
jgi:hypothetical protein